MSDQGSGRGHTVGGPAGQPATAPRSRARRRARRRRRAVLAAAALAVVVALGVGVIALGVGRKPAEATSAARSAPRPPAVPSTTLAVPPGPPRRVLVVGDSTALTLAWALEQTQSTYNATVFDGATFMCGIAIGTEASSEDGRGPTMPMVPACNPATPPSGQWPALWGADIAVFHPQVVVLLAGRWETTDRTYEGRWMDILDRPFADYVERQLQLAVRIATSDGAHLDMLTTACADSGPDFARKHEPNTSVDDDSPARLAAYNDLVRQAAAGRPQVTVVDFDALLCPGGTFHRTIGGVVVRPIDGVHTPAYTRGNPFLSNSTAAVADRFAAWLGPHLWPQLLSVPMSTDG